MQTLKNSVPPQWLWHGFCTNLGVGSKTNFFQGSLMMKKYLTSTSILGLVLDVGSAGSMFAQRTASQKAAPQTDQPLQQDSSQESSKQQDTKAFTGMIVKDGSKLVLKDMSSNMAYKVDDEKKVKDFVGKMVKITGTLDQPRNVIQIESIEIVS
jgi:hypothetical protein